MLSRIEMKNSQFQISMSPKEMETENLETPTTLEALI